jgi:hypothetical protein
MTWHRQIQSTSVNLTVKLNSTAFDLFHFFWVYDAFYLISQLTRIVWLFGKVAVNAFDHFGSHNGIQSA